MTKATGFWFAPWDARVRDPAQRGATRADVLRLVLRRAAVLIGVGVGVGLAGLILLVRLIAKLLFETAPLDPVTFLAAPAFLAAVALSAGYVPARRATRVDPMIALRYE